MGYSPPKKATVMLSFLILIIGIILGICGVLNVIKGGNISDYLIYAGLGLCFLSWLLMWIGVKLRGV